MKLHYSKATTIPKTSGLVHWGTECDKQRMMNENGGKKELNIFVLSPVDFLHVFVIS